MKISLYFVVKLYKERKKKHQKSRNGRGKKNIPRISDCETRIHDYLQLISCIKLNQFLQYVFLRNVSRYITF